MKRNKHSLSHYVLTTFDMGELIPISCVEVLPNDTFRHGVSALVRLSPLLAPVMHPVQVRVHSFYVPTRLLGEADVDWESFITGGEDGADASTLPTITVAATPETNARLLMYLGVPANYAGSAVLAFPARAYNLVYNEFYRDQDLVTAVSLDSDDIQKVAWERDYYTSARPWTQKGPDVSIPLGTTADVKYGPAIAGTDIDGNYVVARTDASQNGDWWNNASKATSGNANSASYQSNLYTDLTNATAASINDLREAWALQRYEEARARYGARYAEYLRYLGVSSGRLDARLQRPEFLGGGKVSVAFSEVLQTAEGTNPVGMLRGHGIAAVRTRPYQRYFEEHGYVITLMSVRPKAIYQDGVNRKWLRAVKEDFYQRELELIGQQAIINAEVYGADSGPTDVFGYQDRYREYKEEPSFICGEFRTSLDHWHMGRQFGSDPALNQTFTDCSPRKDMFASTSTHGVYVMANHNIKARRMVTRKTISRII